MLALAPLLLVAAPAPQCTSLYHLDATATVTAIHAPLAGPLSGAAIGDAATLHVELGSDIACITPAGLQGYGAQLGCGTLVVGAGSTDFDPAAEACVFGEAYNGSFDTVRSELDVTLAGGTGAIELRLLDPNTAVGIGLAEIAADTIDVAGVTDPGFAATFLVRDAAGGIALELALETISARVFPIPYCTNPANSSGRRTRLYVEGSNVVAADDLTLGAIDLPASSFVLFLTSESTGFFTAPGVRGALCLSGQIGRFARPGEVQPTGTGAFVELAVDLADIPTPTGSTAILAGETRYFQAWYRDVTGGIHAGFSDAFELQFQ